MRKLAHYFYGDGEELVITAERRKVFVRKPDGSLPFDPCYAKPHPYPGDGTDTFDWSFETLGLYYGYDMPDTGWSGDC